MKYLLEKETHNKNEDNSERAYLIFPKQYRSLGNGQNCVARATFFTLKINKVSFYSGTPPIIITPIESP
jgi:hypothetical protein